MRQATLWVETLKRELRQNGVTYAQVATALELSEASVKRLFAERSFSLDRLAVVCDLIGIDFLELAHRADAQRELADELSEEQEQALVDDPALFLVGTCALNRWTFTDICSTYELSEPEVIKRLAALDRFGIIELLPNNRIRPLVSKHFRWRRRGPIQRYFTEKLLGEFLNSTFDEDGDVLEFAWGTLTNESRNKVRKKLLDLCADVHQFVVEDEGLPKSERSATSLLIAFRRFEPRAFSERRRDGAT